MKITADQLAKAMFIYVDKDQYDKRMYDHTEELGKASVMVDYSKSGEVLGFELLFARTTTGFRKLKKEYAIKS